VPLSEKKIWNEFLDAETAPHLVSAKAFINGLNIRFGSTELGATGCFESVKGNTTIEQAVPAGDNICIGACADDTDRYAIFFGWNSNDDHAIYLYDLLNQTRYMVLEDSDVTQGLNFDRYKLINGAHVINGLLYFTDGNNEPRRLNLGVFMEASGGSPYDEDYTITLPIDETEITLIRKPCAYPPSITKSYNSGYNNNFVDKNSYKFAVRYVYFDGEEAVLSGWSRASLFNLTTDNYNFIKVKLDITETVPQSVRLVQLVRLDESTEKAAVIKQWDRNITAENVLINTQDLSYDFYGDVTGETLASADMVRPFHSVPLFSGTMAPGKNRNILADNTEGYDTPATTSLALALPTAITLGFTTLSKNLIILKHRNGRVGSESYAYIGYYVYLTEVVPVGWYALTATELIDTTSGTYPTLAAAPSTVAFSGLAFRGADMTAVVLATAEAGTWRWDGPFLTYTASACSITGISTSTYPLMLPQSQYKAGITFYDRYLRKCGIVEGSGTLSVPARNFAFTTGYASIDWTLNNAAAATEIPDWAYYYSVDRSLNLTTRNFISAYDETTKYATRNPTTGLLEYTALTFSNTVVAVALDTSALLRAGLGYTLTDGDQCILIRQDSTTYNLPVIGQDGKYILLKATDVGTLNTVPATTVKFVYRIYSPYKTSEQEPFFQVGDLYPVTTPGDPARTYSVLLGSFRGDVVALTRNYNSTTYYAEAMNPNDLYYQRWFTDAGRPNVITKLGQVRKKTGISFSNVYIPGTQTNGLSGFEALNKEILATEMGTIRKLILASKVQAEGSVMLAIGENQTASIYLGEVELFDQKGNSFLAKSTGFIGQVNILKGDYGTNNPESVVQHNGQVAWIDVKSYCAVRYAGNGLFPISDLGMKRAIQAFCKRLEGLEAADDVGTRRFIFGGVDPYHNEFLWALPQTEEDPPKGYIDYGGTGLTGIPIFTMKYIANRGAGQYQAYSVYAVFLNSVVTTGWYAITNTAVLGAIVTGLPAYATLGTAPTMVSFGDLQFMGANEAAFAASILAYMVLITPASGLVPTEESHELEDTGEEVNVGANDYTYPYPYDIYDGLPKVLVFRINESKWSIPHGYEPEMFCTVGSSLLAFKDGKVWEQGKNTAYNTFFGDAGKSRIMFVARTADTPSKIKTELALAVEANMPPTFVHLRTETPNVQSSDLEDTDFRTREGIYYAPILRDRLSPNVIGGPLEKLRKGDRMRGPWMYIMAEWDTDELLQLKFINIGHRVAAGHQFV